MKSRGRQKQWFVALEILGDWNGEVERESNVEERGF